MGKYFATIENICYTKKQRSTKVGDHMEQKLSRTSVMATTVVLAIAAYFLRLNQLAVAFDAVGNKTGKGVALFNWVTAAALLLFGLYSRSLKGRKKYAAIAGQSMPVAVVGGLAALMMAISGVLLLLHSTQQGDWMVAAGSILTALCWAAAAALRYRGKRIHAGLFILPAVFYIVELVFRFRFWTRDPIILDYCYDLAALICVMCAVFHLGSFAFDKGVRRLTVFFSMCGVFFCAAAMADASGAEVLGYGAAILWLLDYLWLLLRQIKQKTPCVPEEAG